MQRACLRLQPLSVCRDVPQPGVQLLHLRPQLCRHRVSVRAALLGGLRGCLLRLLCMRSRLPQLRLEFDTPVLLLGRGCLCGRRPGGSCLRLLLCCGGPFGGGGSLLLRLLELPPKLCNAPLCHFGLLSHQLQFCCCCLGICSRRRGLGRLWLRCRGCLCSPLPLSCGFLCGPGSRNLSLGDLRLQLCRLLCAQGEAAEHPSLPERVQSRFITRSCRGDHNTVCKHLNSACARRRSIAASCRCILAISSAWCSCTACGQRQLLRQNKFIRVVCRQPVQQQQCLAQLGNSMYRNRM